MALWGGKVNKVYVKGGKFQQPLGTSRSGNLKPGPKAFAPQALLLTFDFRRNCAKNDNHLEHKMAVLHLLHSLWLSVEK